MQRNPPGPSAPAYLPTPGGDELGEPTPRGYSLRPRACADLLFRLNGKTPSSQLKGLHQKASRSSSRREGLCPRTPGQGARLVQGCL